MIIKFTLLCAIVFAACALDFSGITATFALAESLPDTLVVQTFTFADIETRRGNFEFPTGDQSYQRILMHYTLKCDDATVGDPYPCGEWDVTTHTLVHVHTGQMGSTLLTHPSFKVEGEAPGDFSYSTEPRYHFFTSWSEHNSSRDGDRYLRFSGTDCISPTV